nr:MAG TPA: hypothetical protein [Caudoviricetes sp.]
MPRIRTRMSGRAWTTNHRRTSPGTCPHRGAERDRPRQKHGYHGKPEDQVTG